jgi:endonuclease/exonuclease/phosphatase family metal-dependent hydrolase
MAALQEVDSGSLRSGFINQSRYIASHAALPYWFHQSNRKVGNMAYPGIGFIARLSPDGVAEHRLPGALPGRGALVLNFGGRAGLTVAVVHLALGPKARGQQLRYLAEHLADCGALIVMGDLNARADNRQVREFRAALDLAAPTAELNSYPAWKPRRPLDHILVSRNIHTHDAQALNVAYSDHLPVTAIVDLPPGLLPVPTVVAPDPQLASGV